MKFALAGNPNCGKTTLFNSLTGSTAHVGNWPGVTVDKREGVYKKLEEKIDIVDLPGIYSLSPYTPEEIVSRNFIVDEQPDCIINVVDATNLERNLYLTTQLLEIDIPVVIALNMMDLVKASGSRILIQDLENKLKVPVVEISALKGENLKLLMETAYKASKTQRAGMTIIQNPELQSLISKVEASLNVKSSLFHAIKLIENDEIEVKAHEDLVPTVSALKRNVNTEAFEGDFEALISDERYKYITASFKKSVIKKDDLGIMTKSDKIDKVLTHRIWSIPIFLLIMFVVFHFVFSEDLLFLNRIFDLSITNKGWINFFTGMGYQDLFDEAAEEALNAGEVFDGIVEISIPSLGVFLQSWMGWLTGSIIDLVASVMPEGTWYTGLVVDGLLTGIDSIFSFIPQVLLLFLFISILEDSGYMARVAFIMDRAFRKFGLSGKSFIPLLMGFGCSVPAMMSAKTLEDEKERDLTIRLTPFFSCGAKAPIWSMLALIFAGSFLGDVFVFLIYLLGIVIAIVSALVMKLFSKNREVPPFIMELPQYHRPQVKNLLAHLWEKFKHFLYKASTIITASIILIWFLSNFGWAFWKGMVDIEDSMLAGIGHVLKYIFYPLGWAMGDDGWKYSVATITGLIAKEDVVATMASLGLTEATINLSTAAVFSFAAYNLFTLPCFAAVATAKSESSKKGFIVTLLWWLGASYVVSFIVYWTLALLAKSVILGILLILVLVALVVVLGIYLSGRLNKKTA